MNDLNKKISTYTIEYNGKKIEIDLNDIELTRIKRDSNGNPRYVAHFLELLSLHEQKEIVEQYVKNHGTNLGSTNIMYLRAVAKSRSIGGKKYRGRDFGGGIVFQSYNVRDLKQDILKIREGV